MSQLSASKKPFFALLVPGYNGFIFSETQTHCVQGNFETEKEAEYIFSCHTALRRRAGLDFTFLLNVEELIIKIVKPLLDPENEPMATSFEAI